MTMRLTMSRAALAAGCLVCAAVLLAACGRSERASLARLPLQEAGGAFFRLQIPRGWKMTTAGSCSDFAFFVRDPNEARSQIFFFGQAGPVYTTAYQRTIDQAYMSMGGYPTPWVDAPLVDPLSPEEFAMQLSALLGTQTGRAFMPDAPKLDGLRVISSTPGPSPIAGGRTAIVRAVFAVDGKPAEGLFSVTVAQLLPFTGSPGGGIASGFLITGVTAPQGAFGRLVDDLVRSAASLDIEQSYVRGCLSQQEQRYEGILKAGRTLSEASESIQKGWEERSRSGDILSEKWSDAIRGVERLRDPKTGKVYEFENGFYDTYRLDPHRYRLQSLEPLPDEAYDLWTAPTLDGTRALGG